MVLFGVRQEQRVETLDVRFLQPLQDRAVGRAGVHEHGGRAKLEQGRIALADVEEGDDELAGLGRRVSARAQREDEHSGGEQQRAGGGDASPRRG